MYNRLKRNNLDPEVEEKFNQMYYKQKNKVKAIVSEECLKHEKKITENIKKDKSRKIWENINYLRGLEKNKKVKDDTYAIDRRKLEEEEVKTEVKNFWESIYQKTENSIEDTWSNSRESYINDLRNNTITVDHYTFPHHLHEHMDYFLEIPSEFYHINPMEEPNVTTRETKTQINKMKNNKAPGQNAIQIELYKSAINNNTCLEKITAALNNTIQNDQIPANWCSSITKLIPKNKKPTVKDYRPIALTDSSYKICMGILKHKMEQHLKNNSLNDNHQFGFTAQRRTTDSTYILTYLIEHSFKKKQMLIITSVDFKKAFDSVKRDKLLEVMKKYKIHTKVIDMIVNIYKNDSTRLIKNNNEIDKIDISSGIRQGCNGSTVLFLMVTYLIIQEITRLNIGIKINNINLSTLFFADDGLLMTNCLNDAENAINKLEEVGSMCGLDLNKDKSYHVININRDNIMEINNIKVVKSLKYLGFNLNEGRSCFSDHKKLKIKKSKELASMIMSIIARSSNKLLIGKTYWKNVALPEVMYGGEIVPYTKSEIKEIQRSENLAYRQILSAPRYAPTCTLRGEIGSSDMESRDQTTKIKYMRHLITSENDLLKEVAKLDLANKTTKFCSITLNYLGKLNISINQLASKTDQQLKEAVNRQDNERWVEEKSSKTTLEFYNKFKKQIKEKNSLYDNSEESVILFRARTNTLPLYWRNRFKQNAEEAEQLCPLCKQDIETLKHFLLTCPELMHIRTKYASWDTTNQDKALENVLCFNGKNEGKSLLKELWSVRKKKIGDCP